MRLWGLLMGMAACADRPLPLSEATVELRDLAAPSTPDLATLDLASPDLASPDLASPDLPDLGSPDLTTDLRGGPDLAGIRFDPPRRLVDVDTWNSFSAGDFNGDGVDDLVARDGQNVVVLLGDATQPLGVRVDTLLSSSYGFLAGWGIADFDGDGHLDVALGVQRGELVLVGAGDGSFQPGPVSSTIAGGGSSEPLAGDFDGDGFPDIAYGGWTGGLSNAHPYLAVIAPRTGGTIGYLDYQLAPSGMLISDFDVDGHLDALVTTWTGALLFMRGNGIGGFAAPVQSPGEIRKAFSADLDGDGVPDLVFAHPYAGATQAFPGTISYRRGLGDGSFAAPIDHPVSPYSEWLAFADFDRDGHLDVAVGSNPPMGQMVSAPLQLLPGANDPAEPIDSGTDAVFGMVSGDFDGDGRADLVIGQQIPGALTRLILLRNASP